MQTLENDYLQINIKEQGAELTRILSKENNIDYLWNGNPDFWNRHSPILFPFVGRLKNNTYFVDDKNYQLSQHGFARNCMFKLIEFNTTKNVFELTFSEKTLEKYPYKFKLQISYELQKNTLIIDYNIVNKDNKDIYFSVGAHPAFNCPLSINTSFTDYYIEFENKENINQLYLDNKTGLIQPEKTTKVKLLKIPLTYDLFKNDALIFEKIQSDFVSLKSTKHQNGITLKATNWDYFAFWTKKDAPFICFEPWMGIADFSNTNQNIKNKKGIKKLTVNNKYAISYSITFF